jgi:signal transduction histidine kinase/ActR/RegA family two-component response regulator
VPAASERSFRLLVMVAVIMPLFSFLAAAWYDYHQVSTAERGRLLATADTLAEHAQKVLETDDLALALVADRVVDLSWEQIRQDRPLHLFLSRLKIQLPQLESVFLVDPAGRIAASSRAFPMQQYDVSGRDYFAAAQAHPHDVFVSAPFRGMMAGTIAFTVSRGLPGGGLVAVTVSPDYFRNFYDEITQSSSAAVIDLVRDDGAVLSRYPEALGVPAFVPANSATRKALAGTGPVLFTSTSVTDGLARRLAFRHLQGFPVAAVYGASVTAYLAGWYYHVAVLAAFALITSALLGFATQFAMRRTRGEREKLRRLLEETERREQAEAALRQSQKLEALGRLTGGIAHDFNNLLTAIIGGLELAARRTADPRVSRLLDGAMQAAQRGARLTQQMLAISRHEQLRMQPVDINSALRNVHELLGRTLGPMVVVRQDLAGDLWPGLADPTQLEVSILNLAINARDAMPDGGELRLATANLAAGAERPSGVPAGDLVVLRVADTGTGMPEEVLRRATEPFFTTKEVGRGTGLGLSMVDGLARQAGGAMTIESALGRGTTVSVFLPRAGSGAASAGAEPAVPAAGGPHLSVLLVDDDAQVRHSSANMLRELGHSVVEAADGEAALAAIGHTKVDIAVVDFAMPGMHGGEVAYRLGQRLPALPVLIVTGYASRPAAEGWLDAVSHRLAKPFTLAQLAEAMAAAMARAPSAPRAGDASTTAVGIASG